MQEKDLYKEPFLLYDYQQQITNVYLKGEVAMKEVHLSNSEWEIMNVIWEIPYITINRIVIKLNEKKFWDKHTVITLLGRMEKKGAIAYERNGKAKEYYPLISQSDTTTRETERFLERVFRGSLSLMVNSFISNGTMKKEELDELYQIIRETEKRDGE